MARSISIVEYKVQQAHFFLDRIESAGPNGFAAQCFADAFAGAARSITFALQAVMSSIEGFPEWYSERQANLKGDPVCRFFNRYRRLSVHIGDTAVHGFAGWKDDAGNRVVKNYFLPSDDLPEVPAADVLSICTDYFRTLLELVYDAVTRFRFEVDERWYFTLENFQRMGKSFEDAVTELGFTREWAPAGECIPERERWAVLRRARTVGCTIDGLFSRFLGKTFRGPDDSEAGSGSDLHS